MVTWVLQKASSFDLTGINSKIKTRLDETGHEFKELIIVPFSHEVIGGDPIISGPVVTYGPTLLKSLVERNNWIPGIWTSSGIDESSVRDALGSDYMNHEMKVVPFDQAVSVAEENNWEFWFVKPNVFKYFPGTIVDSNKFPFFIENELTKHGTPSEFDVCISPIKHIGIEWRLVIVDSKVVDYSIYRQWRKVIPSREIYPEVLEFAQKIIKLHNPLPAYVMDIGQVDDELKIIEYNPFNHAGLYACDIPNIVDSINKLFTKM